MPRFIFIPTGVAPLPVFVANSKGGRSTGSSNMSIAKPSGVADGNVIYAFCWHIDANENAFTASGWTQVYHHQALGALPTLTILKRTVSGDGATYTFVNAGGGAVEIHLVAYSGGAGEVVQVGVIARASSNTITASSISPAAPGVLLAAFYDADDPASVSSPPSGMTQRTTPASAGGGVSATVYELTPSPAGATGAKSLTWSTSDDVAAILMQIA